jgi:hypothetical protein
MRPWTEEMPDRLHFELQEFERLGLDFKPDSRELDKRGRLILQGHVPHEQAMIEAHIVYPDSFPYMRPEVYAPGLTLHRHQNPFNGNLCLLDRSSRAWDTTDTGAWLIAERLPYLLTLLEQGGEVLRSAEAPQGEPVTSFLASASGAVMFIPEQTLQVPAEIISGTLTLGLGMQRPVAQQLRAALLSVTAERKDPRAKLWHSKPVSPTIAARFGSSELKAVWVRLPELPRTRDPNVILESVRAIHPAAADARWKPSADGQISVLGLLVPEEVRQGEIEQAWVFLIQLRPPAGISHPAQAYLLRGERFSLRDLQERIPALHGSSEKTVSLAGLGSLGGTLAMELARAQVNRLRLLDIDHVEAGNIVRWPFGLTAVGHPKSEYLARHINIEYPFTEAQPVDLQIGQTGPPGQQGGPSEAATLTRFLDGSDLVIDATAELGVAQLLADLATAAGIPLLSIWATEGGWGGGIVELQPDSPGCWYCLQLRLADGSVPAPLAEPNSNVQPRGCSAPTFTATSFDMLEIVAQTMRATRRILLAPTGISTVHICSTRNPDGSERSAPHWSTHRLQAHPECPCCCSAAAKAA